MQLFRLTSGCRSEDGSTWSGAVVQRHFTLVLYHNSPERKKRNCLFTENNNLQIRGELKISFALLFFYQVLIDWVSAICIEFMTKCLNKVLRIVWKLKQMIDIRKVFRLIFAITLCVQYSFDFLK